MFLKRLLPLALFLLPLFSLQAQDGNSFADERALKGISLESRIYTYAHSEDDQSAFKGDFTFMPTLHYKTEGNLEITPYLLVRYEVERDENHIQESNPEIYTELNRLSIGAGTGLYWRFLETRSIDVLSGFRPELNIGFPQWGRSAPTGYYNFDPGKGSIAGTVDIPLGFEVNPFGSFYVRLWVELLRMGIRWDEEYYRDSLLDRSITFFSYSPFWTPDWTPDIFSDWIAYPTPISFSFIWAF